MRRALVLVSLGAALATPQFAHTFTAKTTSTSAGISIVRVGVGRASFASDPAGPRLSARVTAFNKKNGTSSCSSRRRLRG